MTKEKTNKTMYRRIIRALKFDTSVYEEVASDSEATKQAILVPLVMQLLIFTIVSISAIPLAINTESDCLPCVTAQIITGYGIFVLFLFAPFIIWVPLLFGVGRFAGAKNLKAKQVLRIIGFAFSPLFILAFFIVTTMYSTSLVGPVASAPIFGAGIIIVATLIMINSVAAFKKATGVTTGVSIMSNFFALIILGLIFAALVITFSLTILELLKSTF